MMTSTPSYEGIKYVLKNNQLLIHLYQVSVHHYQLLITPTPEPSTPSSVPSAPTPGVPIKLTHLTTKPRPTTFTQVIPHQY